MFRVKCNIGWGGRALRLATGLLFLGNGLMMWATGLPGTGVGSRLLQGFLVLFGLFVVYEGAVGWCAVKAFVERHKPKG